MKYMVNIYTTTKQRAQIIVEASCIDEARGLAGEDLGRDDLEWDEYDWTCDDMIITEVLHEDS